MSIWEGDRFPDIVAQLDTVPVTRVYELDADRIFRTAATDYVMADPWRWVGLGVKKAAMLWTIDPYYPRARSILYIVPTLLTGILLILGLGLSLGALRQAPTWTMPVTPLVIICLGLTGVFAITYVLPRYQTYVFTLAMPLIAIVADRLPSTWWSIWPGASNSH